MRQVYVFADEAGDFTFERSPKASRYFIACAVAMEDCDVGLELLRIRRELAWSDAPIGDQFHASEDKQVVRDRVFQVIADSKIRVFAQVLEKSKAQPQIRSSKHRFYQHAWYYLFRFTMPRIVNDSQRLMVTTASIGTKKGQAVFSEAVKDVLGQTVRLPVDRVKMAFWPAVCDPCLQVTDYCTWAIQRKWERNDLRSHALIASKIEYEFDTWSHGIVHHY